MLLFQGELLLLLLLLMAGLLLRMAGQLLRVPVLAVLLLQRSGALHLQAVVELVRGLSLLIQTVERLERLMASLPSGLQQSLLPLLPCLGLQQKRCC